MRNCNGFVYSDCGTTRAELSRFVTGRQGCSGVADNRRWLLLLSLLWCCRVVFNGQTRAFGTASGLLCTVVPDVCGKGRVRSAIGSVSLSCCASLGELCLDAARFWRSLHNVWARIAQSAQSASPDVSEVWLGPPPMTICLTERVEAPQMVC